MKLPNGYGSVIKLSGNRRKPWRARKTSGYILNDNGKTVQQYIELGCYETKAEALKALAKYNECPYNVKDANKTFSEIYELWLNEKKMMQNSNGEKNNSVIRGYISAYYYCQPLYTMKFKDIRCTHIKNCILNAKKTIKKDGKVITHKATAAQKMKMKSFLNMIFDYATENEIVLKNYARSVEIWDNLKTTAKEEKKERKIYSYEQILHLWDFANNCSNTFAKMIIIQIYTGLRPSEIALLKQNEVFLDKNCLICGMKTEAGRNRLIPLVDEIIPLIKTELEKSISEEREYIFKHTNSYGKDKAMTYGIYRHGTEQLLKTLGYDHTLHEARHTFITVAKLNNMDEYILKLIVGHEISDITEKIYTHRDVASLYREMEKFDINVIKPENKTIPETVPYP